jgi:hypothetical protein
VRLKSVVARSSAKIAATTESTMMTIGAKKIMKTERVALHFELLVIGIMPNRRMANESIEP